MIVEIDAAGSGMDEHETSPRGTGTKNAKWRLDYTARHGETSRVFLNLAHFWLFDVAYTKNSYKENKSKVECRFFCLLSFYQVTLTDWPQGKLKKRSALRCEFCYTCQIKCRPNYLRVPPYDFILFNNYSPKANKNWVNKNRDEVDVFIHRYSSSLRWIIGLV